MVVNEIQVTYEVVAPSKKLNRKLNIELVEKVVLKYFNINKSELLSRSRKTPIIERKQIFHYLCKLYTRETLDDIGNYKKSGYNHASVLHSISRMQDRIDTEPYVKQIFKELNKEMREIQLIQIDENNLLDVLIKGIAIDLLLCKSEDELKDILTRYLDEIPPNRT